MLALMFMSFFEVVIAIAFFGIYLYESIAMKKQIKYEQNVGSRVFVIDENEPENLRVSPDLTLSFKFPLLSK